MHDTPCTSGDHWHPAPNCHAGNMNDGQLLRVDCRCWPQSPRGAPPYLRVCVLGPQSWLTAEKDVGIFILGAPPARQAHPCKPAGRRARWHVWPRLARSVRPSTSGGGTRPRRSAKSCVLLSPSPSAHPLSRGPSLPAHPALSGAGALSGLEKAFRDGASDACRFIVSVPQPFQRCNGCRGMAARRP